MKKKCKLPSILLASALALTCLGCASSTSRNTAAVIEDGSVQIGSSLRVEQLGSELKISEQFDTLAADGLYYATWTIGEPVEFVNSDGDTAQLYDAQLYMLLGEYRTAEKASENVESWIAAANENYEVISEQEVTAGTVTYHVITYNCTSETNPYDRGISAFASTGTLAVCAELTSQADYKEDLTHIMTDFLNHCIYTDN